MPPASVIVPVRDGRQTLGRTLAGLQSQHGAGRYEVIVVDDGSSDGSGDLARSYAGVTVIEQPPLGPAAARNRGVERSRGELLAFCDADVTPTPGWLAAGVRALRGADLVQGMVIPDPDAPIGPFDRSLWIRSQVGLFETANLFTTRAAFDRAGGFEQWLAPRSGKALAEDVWFGYRAIRSGARSVFCPQALAHHAVFPRSWPEYAAERRRLRYFPAMARRAPELRDAFFFRRVFLSRRSAGFDAACAGALTALAFGSPLPLLACLPYLREARRHSMRARPAPPRAAAVMAADLAADLVGLASLLEGSLRYRSPVL